MNTNLEPDVAVVGGGLAGLLASLAAAKAGASVTLIDRGSVGGRARSTRTDGGFCLNRGPHALYVGHALDRAVRSFGVVPKGAPPSQRGARGLVDDRLGRLPGGPVSLLMSDLVPLRAKGQVARHLAGLGRLKPAEYRHLTVDKWIDGLKLHPSVQRLFHALVRLTTYSADSGIASAETAIAQVQSGLKTGVVYLDDGWQQLVDGLTSVATTLGVELRTGCGVRQLEGTAVRLDDDTIVRAGSVVVAGLTPTQVGQLVAGSTGSTALAAAAGPPVEAACLDIGVEGGESSGIVLGLDEPLYLSRHAPPASLAPPGHCLYSAARYLRRDETHDRHQVAERLLRLAHQAGIAADTIVETRYSHRLRVADGQPLAASGGLAGRPDVSAVGVAGVFVAGDWVGPEGLLADASAASALSAAQHAVAYTKARTCSR